MLSKSDQYGFCHLRPVRITLGKRDKPFIFKFSFLFLLVTGKECQPPVYFIIYESSLGLASDTPKLAALFLHFSLVVRLVGLGFNN